MVIIYIKFIYIIKNHNNPAAIIRINLTIKNRPNEAQRRRETGNSGGNEIIFVLSVICVFMFIAGDYLAHVHFNMTFVNYRHCIVYYYYINNGICMYQRGEGKEINRRLGNGRLIVFILIRHVILILLYIVSPTTYCLINFQLSLQYFRDFIYL